MTSISGSGIRPRRQWSNRTRVRNDDSIVLELALRNVSMVLPGDIGPAVERTLAAQHDFATPAARRADPARADLAAPMPVAASHDRP